MHSSIENINKYATKYMESMLIGANAESKWLDDKILSLALGT